MPAVVRWSNTSIIWPWAESQRLKRAARASDPVCGMTVDPATAKHKAEHGGTSYLFLLRPAAARSSSPTRRDISRPQPQAAAEPRAAGRDLHLPDAPEIRQAGPGTCPICGMALEPETATAEDGPNPELIDMTRRFWIGAGARRPGGRAGNGRPSPWLHALVRRGMSNWIQFVLATPVVLWAGLAVLRARLGVGRQPQSQYVHA